MKRPRRYNRSAARLPPRPGSTISWTSRSSRPCSFSSVRRQLRASSWSHRRGGFGIRFEAERTWARATQRDSRLRPKACCAGQTGQRPVLASGGFCSAPQAGLDRRGGGRMAPHHLGEPNTRYLLVTNADDGGRRWRCRRHSERTTSEPPHRSSRLHLHPGTPPAPIRVDIGCHRRSQLTSVNRREAVCRWWRIRPSLAGFR